jgi:hypothetical protein
MAHGGKRHGAGRKPGPKPQSRIGIETFAKSIVEDPEVQETMRVQARAGEMPVPLLQMFFHYAYGRPREQQPDDQAFVEDLLAVVAKHADSREARQEIRAVIEAHAGGARLRVVA